MVKETKYYDLLEVQPDASENDLKKAYRKKALRLHPDKGGDPELFKEVTHAYEVLSDSQKRSIYDTRGEAGLSESGGMGGMDPQDLFSQLFGGGGFFGGGGGGSRNQGPRKSKDLVHRVHVGLEDLYKGKTTKLALTRNVICPKCDGKGGKEGAVRSCGTCQGRGVRVTLRQMGPMIQQLQQPCDECSGTGEIINHRDKCKTCNARKVVSEKKMLEVHVDKGMKGGQTITFSGESDQAPGVVPGDVVIVIEEKPHERFKRNDNNLVTDVEIDLLMALGGGQFSIKHLDDRVLVVTIPPGDVVKQDEMKVIHGQGMPSKRHHEMGDLYIKISIKWPEHIDPNKIHLLEQVLPPRKSLPKTQKNVLVEEVDMSDVDPRQERVMQEDPMDEDEGEPRVQCANQ
jgi:DnaJ family protein A protein 2